MSTDLTITKGLPFSRVIRVTGGKNVWPELDDFEIRSELREKQLPTSQFIMALHVFMTAEYGTGDEADDILIHWEMTGADTRSIPSKGKFDIILSDPGVTDARAIPVVSGSIALAFLTTAPED